jgi:hypothetical protein
MHKIVANTGRAKAEPNAYINTAQQWRTTVELKDNSCQEQYGNKYPLLERERGLQSYWQSHSNAAERPA